LAASGTAWTKSYSLQQGQAVIHQVQVDSFALFDLTSPPGAQFQLYAMQIATAGAQNCPSEAAIRRQASYTSQNNFVLPKGQWCVQVYALRGSGTYYLEASSVSAPSPIPPPINQVPVPPPVSEKPYMISVQNAVITSSRPNVHPYLVSGKRTFLEWILEPSDCTTSIDIPIAMMSTEAVNQMQSAVCSLSLNAYVYKDCDPRSSQCTQVASDESESSYAYIGISYPQDKSRYYVLVQSVNGSGSYTLTSRSYVQNSDQPTVMMALSEKV
jgi:hypothetical protein